MILTPNYNLQKAEPGDNLAASRGYEAASYDIIDTRLKADADGIAANAASIITKAPSLSPTLVAASVGTPALRVDGVLGQSTNLQEWRDSTGLVLSRVGNYGGLEVSPAPSSAIGIRVISPAAGIVPLVTRGASGQTANLQEWQDSAGTVLTRVNPKGTFTIIGASDAGAALTVAGANPASAKIVAQGAASQTANLQEWQNNAGTVLARIANGGQVYAQNDVSGAAAFYAAPKVSGAWGFASLGEHAGAIGIIVRGAAGQTANLAEFQNSAGGVIAAIDEDGNFTTGGGGGDGAIGRYGAILQSPNNKGLVIKGAAAQTANLAEFQNSAGTVLAAIIPSGEAEIWMSAVGTRRLQPGAPDSAGAGFRTVRVPN